MAISDNIKQIAEALQERKSIKKAVNKINSENNKNRDAETLVNSVINGLMTTYFSVKDQASQSNIELNGMVIEPNRLTDTEIGTMRDPRVFLEMAKKNNRFNRLFTITKRNNDIGHEQYVIQERKTNF